MIHVTKRMALTKQLLIMLKEGEYINTLYGRNNQDKSQILSKQLKYKRTPWHLKKPSLAPRYWLMQIIYSNWMLKKPSKPLKCGKILTGQTVCVKIPYHPSSLWRHSKRSLILMLLTFHTQKILFLLIDKIGRIS